MLVKIYSKIRALIEDFITFDSEIFTYTTSSIFTLCESNVDEITGVFKNGVELGSGEWSYDSDTNKVTLITGLVFGDIIGVDFKFYKYSNSELKKYVEGSLVWISIKASSSKDYEVEDDDSIYPTPSNSDTDLISIISSILIKPNYNAYKLPNISVQYPRNVNKEEKIEKLIQKYEAGLGVNNVITWDITD